MNMQKVSASLILMLATAILAGCQSVPESHVERSLQEQFNEQVATEKKQQQRQPQALPSAVDALLSADADNSESSLFGVEKYDIEAQNVDMRAFFAGLVADTPYSVAMHPDVTGDITLSLKQVPLPDIINLVAELYNLDVEQRGTVFQVRPAVMRTETFSVDYLLMSRDGSTQTSIISGGVSQADGNNNNNGNSPVSSFSGNSANSNNLGGGQNNANNGVAITTRTETNFWKDLQSSLQSMIGNEEGRVVFVTPQAGLVTVRAMPDEIRAIKHFLQVSEESLQRQVILEARILEVTLSDEFQQGINWNQVIANSGSTDFRFSTSAGSVGNELSAALGGVTSLSFLNQDFSGVLSLLSTQGNVQVLSSPRVTATNNQKAVIKVGDDEYFVTDISSQNTITSTTTSVVPDIELTPFFSGIALDVTPQIDENGSVLLHVHPSVIETQEQEKVVTLNQERIVLPLAQSTIRESDTVIRALSGEIVVIGGLMQTTVSDGTSKTPLLGDIPLLGELFTSRRKQEVKKELIILLKPTVVGPNTWSSQIKASQAKMADWLYIE
ncbi:pilus (MSHA type) biogenesis protein MshL [Alteromonas sediminis]|uniref:Pilus (MSHA type) biogenesis protein MshL n=1 Tax=Alteromonas sediminis TaxID=2259342 RepID=A0A3N5Z538_9ALTE|nr:pilus (MSHA type) biogenesis protein MshL [Alteromonas sediminis]RPJ65334.1 pilus (MSHA type) biogenesis protein MshL [Alteromonas sediminis]